MKSIYVTYEQNGSLKKAVINESRYNQLRTDRTVSNLIVYPNQLLMEQNYKMQCDVNGNCTGSKQILRG